MTSLSLPISAPSQHQQNNMSSPIHPLLSGPGAGLSLSLPSHPSTTLALPTSPLSLPTTSLALPLPPHQQPTQQQPPSPIAQNVRETSVATTHSLADLADACLSVEPLPLAAPEGGSGTGGYMGAGGLAPGFHLAPDGSARRDPGQEVVMHALFPAFYRAFYTPNDQAAKLAFPASPCAGATTCHCVPMPAHAHLNHSANGSSTPASPSAAMVPGQDLVPCEQICHKDPSPRNSLYTPRITKGRGREKMGLCPICFEPPERGGESKVVWHGLPTSKYRAHMIEKHGISTIDGGGYSCPVTIREVESIPVRSRKKERGTKYMAMCHQRSSSSIPAR
ncbi:hypothetical protein BT69DRAFT_612733 [Atractiella rhizophila]|nr:hypothetical protein BT69DRAFT_612733 [Atractiella rhizophila]